MRTPIKQTLPVTDHAGCLLVALAVLVSPSMIQAANVTTTGADGFGASSFNSAGVWSDAAAPSAGNDYFIDGVNDRVRTPPDGNSYTFTGDSLTVSAVGSGGDLYLMGLTYKGSGAGAVVTVGNLILDGGSVNALNSSGDVFNLAGSISVIADSYMYAKQGPINVLADISGTSTITNPGSDGAGRTLTFLSSSSTFSGDLVNDGRFTLADDAVLNFDIGTSGVNNSVSGTGAATVFNGDFVFDLSGASSTPGDSWTIASAAGQTFGATFTVDGFNRVGDGTGAGTWELATNGIFYSFSTGNGILQVVTNLSTNTSLIAYSRVAFLRDSVVATDACLMPGTATYGRAINGISFQNNNILLTFNGYQYTAWYGTVGTAQSVWLARRTVTNTSVGAWETYQTDSEFQNGDENAWDAHNVIAIGICETDGTLHLAWDHHNNTLRYRRSIAGLCTTNTSSWGTNHMLNAEQNWLVGSGQTVSDVTYPQFTITPTGGLVLNRRIGISGDGDQLFYNYIPLSGGTGGNWTPQTLFLSRIGNHNGSTSRNAYINGLDFGPDGRIHVSWTWREGAGTANHDICYAYSTDDGVTWRNNAGTVIADTGLAQSIDLDSSGIVIKSLDMKQLIINQQAQCVDGDGRVHMLMLHRREDPGYEYPNYTTAPYSTLATAYYHYFRDPDSGAWSQGRIPPADYPVGSRPKIGYDADGDVYAAYISYAEGTAVTPGNSSGQLVIASATKATQYTDWAIVQVVNTAFDGEPLIDQARLLSDNVLSVYVQEHSATTSVVGTPLHVFDFAVGMTEHDPALFSETLNFFGEDVVVVVPGEVGFEYQLRRATTLCPPDWTDVGSVVPGVKGLLALPDPNGAGEAQRFHRVRRDP